MLASTIGWACIETLYQKMCTCVAFKELQLNFSYSQPANKEDLPQANLIIIDKLVFFFIMKFLFAPQLFELVC